MAPPSESVPQMETTCGTLLYELQMIWDEVGESDEERDKMLYELEQECLEVYRRKVDQANRSRAQLRRAIADSEAEIAAICSALGEPPLHLRQSNQNVNSLKEELKVIQPHLEDIRKKKSDRQSQFQEIIQQIQKVSFEIGGLECNTSNICFNESDLSIKRLEDLHRELEILQKDKAHRLRQVLDHSNMLNSLCLVLGMDFKPVINEIHPSLAITDGSRSISNQTIERLAAAVEKLREVKMQRMQKLQDLATALLELWNLMDTPVEEQQLFQNVTSNIAASEHELTDPNSLSLDFIDYVAAEVARLEEHKASKMKELVMKKKLELEELRRRTHLVSDLDSELEFAVEEIEAGTVDPAVVLEQIEIQVSNVKEEAFVRKDILDKVEKWLAACCEESWLEEYNRDENRYTAGKGAHLILKRAEKARALVNKIPAMVEALAGKTVAWENERGISFFYDGVKLLSMLEDYSVLRQEKEQERRRQRDQKKLQGQLIAEQEALYGSKPSPAKQQSARKLPRNSMGGPSTNRRLSLGGTMLQPSKQDMLLNSAKAARSCRKADDAAILSSGRRGLDVVGLPVKKLTYPSNAHQVEEDIQRKPFAPMSAAVTSIINHTNVPSRPVSTTTTPSRPISAGDEENRTPTLVPMQTPKTPKTVSAPMIVSLTPAPQPQPVALEPLFAATAREETEYSFEERRAGFVLPRQNATLTLTYV